MRADLVGSERARLLAVGLVEVGVVHGKHVTASLGVDVGYLVTVPVELHALPGDRPDADLSIETAFAGIGKLDSRGWTYSMSFRMSF